MDIQEKLFSLQDKGYRDFQTKLLPTVSPDSVIGVRTPALRTLAKEVAKDTDGAAAFLASLPHRYFDENQLHAFIISLKKDFDDCLAAMEAFLPYIDNWTTCDQLSPAVFRKHRTGLLPHIKQWLASGRTYTVRFAVGMLMQHFLDTDFKREYLDLVASVRSDEYYVRMMQAWYVATALAKQYGAALPLLEQKTLEPWTHNKAIQKACESYRITPEQKAYLRTLRVPPLHGASKIH